MPTRISILDLQFNGFAKQYVLIQKTWVSNNTTIIAKVFSDDSTKVKMKDCKLQHQTSQYLTICWLIEIKSSLRLQKYPSFIEIQCAQRGYLLCGLLSNVVSTYVYCVINGSTIFLDVTPPLNTDVTLMSRIVQVWIYEWSHLYYVNQLINGQNKV